MSLLRRSKSAGPSTPGGTGRTIARRSGKALLGLVLVLALLAGVGAVYQAVATGRAQRASAGTGRHGRRRWAPDAHRMQR